MSTTEYARRATLTEAVLAYFLARPGVWVDVRTLAEIGGFAAWRTRCSDARIRLERDGLGTIRWNGKVKDSAYRYEPVIRPVAAPSQRDLFERATV